MKRSVSCALLAAALVSMARLESTSAAESAERQAARHYQEGLKDVDAGNWAMALEHFKLAYKSVPSDDYFFNMAQCEYTLGRLKDALDHYQRFLTANDKASPRHQRAKAEAVAVARSRVEAINKRPSTFTIGADQDLVDVAIEGVGPDGPTITTGQGPNDFSVPRGRYRITVSKPNYVAQTKDVEIGVAQTMSLFFKLPPVPARLEIRTHPANATLYVRGNRAQNPYVQLVDPGSYEIYAEATDHVPRREVITLSPGAQESVPFRLDYRQRSGRPELIGFWTAAGAVGVSSFVLGVLAYADDPTLGATATLAAAGGLLGGIAGGLISQATSPDYIADNRALFRIGAMWVGAAEGAAAGFALAPALGLRGSTAGWFGGAIGLGGGAVAGALLDTHAPPYGRVAMIQSAAAMGAMMGALFVPAITPRGAALAAYYKEYGAFGVLAGLNLGLGAGLALAYLPDQNSPGPSWRRVALVDLAIAGGAIFGALANTVENCLDPDPESTAGCQLARTRPTSRATMVGAVVGLGIGWFLTRKFDDRTEESPIQRTAARFIPVPAALATQDRAGQYQLVPGLAAQGRF